MRFPTWYSFEAAREKQMQKGHQKDIIE